MNKKKAIYPLSGDPVHNGHLHNLTVAVNSRFFDEVYFSLGNNPAKKSLFSPEERLDLARKVVYSSGLDTSKIKVELFNGMLRNHARRNGIDYIIRGSRNSADFDYEMFLSDFNLEYGLQTFVIPSTKENRMISSGTVKAIVTEGGLVEEYVHPAVKQSLEERLRNLSLIGVTGNMGSGKSTFCREMVEYALQNSDLELNHIDLDKMIHSIYKGNDPMNYEVEEKIKEKFGDGIFDGEELNRKKLAGIVFNDDEKRYELSRILSIPTRITLEDELQKRSGIVLLDAAYLVEYNLLSWVNNNVILVNCDDEERYDRVLRRDQMSRDELVSKTNAQFSYENKKDLILKSQNMIHHGFYHEVDSSRFISYFEILEKIKENFPLKLGKEEASDVRVYA